MYVNNLPKVALDSRKTPVIGSRYALAMCIHLAFLDLTTPQVSKCVRSKKSFNISFVKRTNSML